MLVCARKTNWSDSSLFPILVTFMWVSHVDFISAIQYGRHLLEDELEAIQLGNHFIISFR